MRTNFVLVDFENVQTLDPSIFEIDGVHVVVFLGEHQQKISTDLVLRMQKLEGRGKFVQICSNGPNALDFTIAFTMGQLSRDEPTSYFHIISKDTGFDPLIKYMKSHRILAGRYSCLTDAPFMKARFVKTTKDRADEFVEKICRPNCPKPRSLKTLSNAINTGFANQLSPNEVEAIVNDLASRKFIVVSDQKVTYTDGAATPAI